MNGKQLATLGLTLTAVLALGMAPAVAQTTKASSDTRKTSSASPGERLKVEGTITERDRDSFTLRRATTGSDLLVKVGVGTQIWEKKKNLFRRARKYQPDQLATGLTVEVEGHGDADGALMAEIIRFTNDDFKLARAVDTRAAPLEENARKMSSQVGELEGISNAARGGAKAAQETADKAHDRITSLDDYEVVHSVTVQFQVGSALLSEEAKRSLDELAREAKGRKGFVIEVQGFASSEGSLAFNRRLSRQRSQAVAEYLAEQHDIPLRRIMTPSGYGVSHPVGDNSTRSGRQQNRRAEVKILVSRGMTTPVTSGQQSTSENSGGASARLDRKP